MYSIALEKHLPPSRHPVFFSVSARLFGQSWCFGLPEFPPHGLEPQKDFARTWPGGNGMIVDLKP